MTNPAVPAVSSAPSRARAAGVALAFWAAGMLLAHGPMLVNGLGRVQGNLGVPRMLHYVLEHGYRCVTGDPRHGRFWDPPMFHPAANTAAYSETLAGAAPFYWAWRAAGAPVDLAFPLWILTMSSLNFLSAWHFLRRSLDRSVVASGFGAFLFAFASVRLSYIELTQLLPGFYIVLAVHGLVQAFRAGSRREGLLPVAVFAVAFLAQVYTCFYLAWFFGLSLGLAAFWGVALPSLRPQVLPVLKRQGPALAAGMGAIGIGMLPFLIHSLRAAAEVGYREYDEVEMYLPRLASWIHFGPRHWLYGKLADTWPFQGIPARAEHSICFGFVSTAMAILGLWELRRSALGKILAAVAASLFVLTLMLPGGGSVWALVFLTVPGAGAIRAVARVSLILLLPASVGAATMVDGTRWRKPALIGAALLAMLEQGRMSPFYDRREVRDATAALARRVDPSAEAFWYTTSEVPRSPFFVENLPMRVHVDAMMASLEAGVPTINGYSGWVPPGWPLEAVSIVPDASVDSVEKLLREWCLLRGLDRRRIQWVR